MGDTERSWNCAELKKLVLPNTPIQLSKEGPPLVNQELSLLRGVYLFSVLQAAYLLLPVWQDLVPHSGSRQAVFHVYQQILATACGNNATERQQAVSCGLDSCYSLCLLHSSSALILLTLYLDADIFLLLPSLLSSLS